MKTNFTWGDDIIDSRDIQARFEELNDECESLVNSLEEAEKDFKEYLETADEELTEKCEDFEANCKTFRETIDVAKDSLAAFNQSFDKDELDTLTEVIRQGEDSPDWSYGECLIHESYFTQYIEDLIKDCYEMPKELQSGRWPWNHFSLDYEGAAEEAKSDYFEIDVNGHTYFIRS